MMRELFQAALEQRLSSRLRLALAGFVNFIGGFALTGQLPFGYVAPVITAYIVTAGILGKEFSAGTPQLAFSRPITRASYVLARWLACVATMVAFGLVALGIGLFTPHGGLEARVDLGLFTLSLITGAGVCAVVVGFSALANGFADVVLVATTGVLAGVLGGAADRAHDPVLGHAIALGADALFRAVYPTLTAGGGMHMLITLQSAVTFAATVAGWLLLAIVIVRRREITYATD
jgi:hypothetical protein